ncbi:hypothetical protein CSC2_28010 [Clostridium zeae]|uniref:Uncharacterized protein n=1 Tax=Clostridium zeae TaxID=2759022 RepID=A0ABQ1EBW9_9CLOT|nr:hypothetical protein [Clostridium zeae]GFZ32275.1 hypothetical protein CSC2_28010 [Clostridium zeae]
MNKEFIKKMVKVERYRYEAIKEILPETIRKRVEQLEQDAISVLKDVVVEIMKEDTNKETKKSSTKKVDIEFS